MRRFNNTCTGIYRVVFVVSVLPNYAPEPNTILNDLPTIYI